MNKDQVQDTVFIIDGSSFLYRAYYSIRPLTTTAGLSVNAVYGFCRMIKKLMDTYEPKYILLVWDSRGRTVRHEMYQEYKSSRLAAPSDLIQQKEIIVEFADIIGIKQLAVQGIEADDLMYSVAKELAIENTKAIIVTSDKDMGQCLNDTVTILDPFKEQFITKEVLEAKLEFGIDKLPFYYALVGDSSDNIPGVKGIGPKGAQQLVKQFNSLQELYDNLDKVSSERTKVLLAESKDNAFLSEQLFILRFYETYLTKQSCTFNADNWACAQPLFERLEFKSMIKQSEKEVKGAACISLSEAKAYKFICVTQVDQLNEIYNEIKKHKKFALDTEGTSLNPLEGDMLGLSICVEEGVAYYIPFGHRTAEAQLEKSYVLNMLKPLFEDKNIEKYLHHAKFDSLMFYNEGINLDGVVFDTMIAASLLVADGQRIGLKYLSDYYFQETMLKWADVVKKNKYPDFSYVPLGLATEYAAADAHQTMKLYNIFEKGIHEHNMQDLFHKIEMPLMHVLYDMEKTGISLDVNILKEIDILVTKEIGVLNTAIIDLVGLEFSEINLNSPKQLEDLLFNHLKLPAVKRTAAKTGFSTDQQVLKDLAKIHPVPALIMRYRELFKLKSTYLDALGTYVNSKTNRVHTTFSQTGVTTGRLSSSEPNLQNIPVDKFHIRSAFKADSGHVFLSADYSQIELRILAYVSQDETLLKAFSQNQDIHALTAAGLFGMPLESVTGEQRQIGKRINFSILYGLTAHGLSQDLDISHKLAKQYIERYMAQYPGVSAWMETVVEKTKEKGYTETLWGRRRYLSGIYERNRTLYDLARRAAINTVAQGTASEIMKIGMITLDKTIKEQQLNAKIVLQIHDELLLEVPEAELQQTESLVKNVLQDVVKWNVPLVVTTRSGKNWQEVTK